MRRITFEATAARNSWSMAISSVRTRLRRCGASTRLVSSGAEFELVFRHFPLHDIHPHAEAAAAMSEAAARQGRFWEMHDLLFSDQRHLEDADLRHDAERLGPRHDARRIGPRRSGHRGSGRSRRGERRPQRGRRHTQPVHRWHAVSGAARSGQPERSVDMTTEVGGDATARLAVRVGDRDHVRGPATALVTLVEYGDYECPYCRAAVAIVDELQRVLPDELRFVFRHFPLENLHPHARHAAEAAEAAGAQGRFFEMHAALFEHQTALEGRGPACATRPTSSSTRRGSRAELDAPHACEPCPRGRTGRAPQRRPRHADVLPGRRSL